MSTPRVHHLDCGTMCPLGASLIGSPGRFYNRGKLVCHCLLVETDSGLVLVDTGLSAADLGRPSRLPLDFRLVNKPVANGPTALSHVRRLGFAAEDVRHVFPTHLDLDHAGGLVDFPQATVHLLQAELDAARAPVRGDRSRYVAEQWAHEPKWKLYPEVSGESWFGFEAVRPIPELSEDLAIVPLAGHSAGHCGVAVRSKGHWVLHAGDGFFHRRELEPGAATPFGLRFFQRYVDRDRDERIHNTRRLQKLHTTHSSEVSIFCSHDPWQLEQLQKGNPSAGARD